MGRGFAGVHDLGLREYLHILQRRKWIVLLAVVIVPLAAVALALTGLFLQPAVAMALISLSLAGMYAFKSPFWSLPGLFLSRSTAAVSIAAINSIGNLGGFAGPYAIGAIKDWTGSTYGGLLFLSALLFASFLMTWFARMESTKAVSAKPAEQHA